MPASVAPFVIVAKINIGFRFGTKQTVFALCSSEPTMEAHRYSLKAAPKFPPLADLRARPEARRRRGKRGWLGERNCAREMRHAASLRRMGRGAPSRTVKVRWNLEHRDVSQYVNNSAYISTFTLQDS